MQQMFTCGNCGAPVTYGEPSCRNCGVPLDWSAQQMPDQSTPPPYGYQPPDQQQTWGQQPPYNQQQSWDQPPPYNQPPGWNQPPGPGYPGQYRQKPPYGSRGAPPGKKGFPYGIAILLFVFIAIVAVGIIGLVTDWEFTFNSKEGPSTPTETTSGSESPVISSFKASPTSVEAGGTSTLQWSVTGATSVSIDHGIGDVSASGTKNVSPAATTTYMLTATNSSGSVTELTTVTVAALDLPEITSFTADPATVTTGMSATLKWAVTGATDISIDKDIGDVSASGTKEVSPTATTTYTLTATNGGGSVTKSVKVTFTNQPVVTAFTADPGTIDIGDSTTLDWDVTNATSVSIDHDIGDVSLAGTRTISPSSTTTYTLTATNGQGSVTKTVTVTVSVTGKPVINSFAASYEKITSGLSSTLSWNVSGASEISIEQNVGTDIGVVNATGTKSVEPEATTEYTLTATNCYIAAGASTWAGHCRWPC